MLEIRCEAKNQQRRTAAEPSLITSSLRDESENSMTVARRRQFKMRVRSKEEKQAGLAFESSRSRPKINRTQGTAAPLLTYLPIFGLMPVLLQAVSR